METLPLKSQNPERKSIMSIEQEPEALSNPSDNTIPKDTSTQPPEPLTASRTVERRHSATVAHKEKGIAQLMPNCYATLRPRNSRRTLNTSSHERNIVSEFQNLFIEHHDYRASGGKAQ
jgi:hypothetical protein